MPVALTAINDQRAVCFQSVTIAVASMGLSPPLAEGCSCLLRCAMDPLLGGVKCFPPCSWQVEKGEAFLVVGSTHGQMHRFFF